MNSLHQRALRVVYRDYITTFSKLLSKDKSVTIHQRNLQLLATEVFKIKNELIPEIVKYSHLKTWTTIFEIMHF